MRSQNSFILISAFFSPDVIQLPSLFSLMPRIITPPLLFANAEYVSHRSLGRPPLADFTSRRLSSRYSSNFDKSNNSSICILSFFRNKIYDIAIQNLKDLHKHIHRNDLPFEIFVIEFQL